MSVPACRLYLITPPAIEDIAKFGLALGEALEAGDVGALQIRLKGAPEALLEAVVDVVRPMALAREIAIILNDRPDLAARWACDGVHIGQDDGSYTEARRLVGPHRIVGVTCHASRHLAMEAAEAGADYVAFGAFFPTRTKDAKARAEPEILEIWHETMTAPCVAIGGITVENCRPLVAAGADFLAVSAGVWSYPQGPAAAVAAFNAAIVEGLAERSARQG
ncbi:MAG: thiamine phosphate synthase [Caulobacteraceae bacterium]|nr:thiamine phosphate synthase [Caulobacteraceae bacterium]